MKLLVINGPNLNLLGIREPAVYGTETYDDLCLFLKSCVENKDIKLDIYQSNHEGAIIDKIHEAYFHGFDGIIINPGAYTHTSIAIMDAIKSVMIPTIEVHLSDITKREEFRQVSYIGLACVKRIMGKGFLGYKEAIEYFIN